MLNCARQQLGIVVGLLSTGVQSLGLTLQRKSHILEDEKDPVEYRRPPHRRRRWQIGMAMFIVANLLGSTVQISTLPLPVLSTLQASGLVFNSICATLILGEPFTRWSLWGTLLVCSGAVLIAVFGAIPAPAHNLQELLELMGRRPFVIWMSLQAVLVVGIAVATDLTAQLSSPLLVQGAQFRLVRGLAYGLISGIVSAHSLLVAKSAVELVVRTIADGNNQFVHWQSWMLVLSLVVLALGQLYYLHRGLKLVSTSLLYPLVFCIYNIIAILDGLIYFRQTDLITPLHACLIALGTVILLSGVLALSWRLSEEQHAPAVGQSTLTPGLGLVEDTDGEESEDLLEECDVGTDAVGGNGIPAEEQRLLADLDTPSGPPLARAKPAATDLDAPITEPLLSAGAQKPSPYRTFGGAGPAPSSPAASDGLSTPLTPTSRRRRTPSNLSRHALQQPQRRSSSGTHPPPNPGGGNGAAWAERAEIWGELEDDEPALPSSPAPGLGMSMSSSGLLGHARQRSTTLPVGGGGGGAQRRVTSQGSGMSSGAGSGLGDAPGPGGLQKRTTFRRRRRSTGFPGFTARKARRRSHDGALGIEGGGAVPGGGDGAAEGAPHEPSTTTARGLLRSALGDIWKAPRWWRAAAAAKGKGGGQGGQGVVYSRDDVEAAVAAAEPAATTLSGSPQQRRGQRQQQQPWPPYRDDPTSPESGRDATSGSR